MDQDSWGLHSDPTAKQSQPQNQELPDQKEEEEPEAAVDNWDEEPEEKKNELEESNWLEEIKEKKEPRKNKELSLNHHEPNTSFLKYADIPVGEKQLVPDDPNTTWNQDLDDKKKEQTRGNRGAAQEQEKEPPRRGNRGDRGTQEKKQEQRDVPRRGNRAPRGEQDEQFRRGNREPDFRKKTDYYEQRQGRQGQYDRGGYRGRGNFRGRGSYNNYGNNRGNPRYREKQEGEQTEGQKSSSYQQNYQNRGNRNYNREYNRQEGGNRYDRNYNDNRYQGNRFQNNQEYNSNSNNFAQNNYQPPSPPPSQVEQPKSNDSSLSSLSETQRMTPKGRKCWPETSLNILACKITLTVRPLTDFRCKLLIMPYTTIQMEYYPGNVVNSSSIDYRKKIVSKGEEIASPGAVYLQKAIGVYTFEAIAFIKIDKSCVQDSLKTGIHQVLRLVQKIQKPITLQSLVFPICEQLGQPSWVIAPFLNNLQNCRKIKQVWITTIQGPCYIKSCSAFSNELDKLFKANQIFIS